MALLFRTSALALAGAALAVSACNRQPSTQATSSDAAVVVPTPTASDADAKNSAFLAAAEPFEALTEQAASASPNKLGALIADARKAADGIGPALSAASKQALDKEMTQIAVSEKNNLRTAIALAAVEGYRTLVESAADTGPVPQAVSLLDYAGFRYQANLAAKPVDWNDVDAAVSVAREKWLAVEAKVADPALHREFATAVDDMAKAAKVRDATAAMTAATKELDLVDKLETYFTKNG